ncbi:uncharacterized protein [Montipora foliosa]|uniref:uncharacterized protein n=1 Tax=Montipora foliosa TaxID=591990 RepID=UPI0035F1027E
MAANNLLLFTMVICLGVVFLSGKRTESWNDASVNELFIMSKGELDTHTKNTSSSWPFCVLYRDPNAPSSRLEGSLIQLLESLKPNSFMKNWTVATFNLDRGMLFWEGHPGKVPALHCHIWTAASPVSYPVTDVTKITSRSLLWWFKNVKRLFASRITTFPSEFLSDVVEDGGYSLVGVPGRFHHQTVEKDLIKVAKSWKKRIKVFIVIPQTEDEMNITKALNISQLPAVIVFSSAEWKDKKRPVAVLEGIHDVGERSLEISLVALNSHAIHLNLDNFRNEVLETRHPQPPIVVCFYSPRSSYTLNYLSGFHRSYDTYSKMRISLRFGILNIADHPQVISRYVNASSVSTVPFTVAFWQEREKTTQRFFIKQQVFDRGIPTPLLLYKFLKQLSVNLLSTVFSMDDGVDDEIYNPWKESSDSKNVCYLQVEDETCAVDAENQTLIETAEFGQKALVYGPDVPPDWWKIKVADRATFKPKKFQFSYVTDKTWSSLIEQSSIGPVKSYSSLTTKHPSQFFSVALVVFLINGCSYCNNVMPTIQQIAIDSKFLGASLYIHNCSSDPLTCQRYGITGYPTLTAFRSLSWSAVESCSSSQPTYLRLDYHGPVIAKQVLEWLSNVSQPAVDKSFLFSSLPDMDVDVRLIGTVYTRSLARRYLPPSLRNKWYHFRCFKLICELLFGRVSCYATHTQDVVDDGSKVKAKETDLVLSKLELQRSDGVRVKVFQLGRNVETTINTQRDSKLHMFHDIHRYDVPKNFKCEHDHRRCTDVVLKFVHDHRRLPVLHMTFAAFHTKLGSDEDASFEPFAHDLPMLLALAHKENITNSSSFYRELTEAAYAMYRDMVFVILDIDEFAHWASRFVPKDYHAKNAFGRLAEDVPVLYRYPRLCIIQPDDHQHAAFYPPVSELQDLGSSVQARLDGINSQQIIKFAQDYLNDPAAAVVKTEFF